MNELFYRFTCCHVGGGSDEDGYYSSRTSCLSLHEYRVVKRTEKGVWLKEGRDENCITSSLHNNSRFVLPAARKRFACPTIGDALISFIARKKKQKKILRQQIADLDEVIKLAGDRFRDYSLTAGDL